jgi:predicted nucleic acid-binding protein
MSIVDTLQGVRCLFLDTAPVIYHVEGVATYQPVTDVIFQEIGRGTVEAITSSVTLAECLVYPYKRGDMALAQRFRNVITAGVHTCYVGIDMAAEKAAELRARYNLSLTDAFQVAAALSSNCEAFLTNENGIKRVTALKVLVLDDLLKSIVPSQ